MKKIVLYLIICLAFSYSQQWTNISPFPESDVGVFGNFISKNEGWIKQSSIILEQSIYHTIDGGKNWDKIFTLTDGYIRSFRMIDSSNGWMIKVASGNYFYLKTTNAGLSWQDMSEFIPKTYLYMFPYFINEEIGFFCSGSDSLNLNAQIYKTTDGGYNWSITETPVEYDEINSYPLEYLVNNFHFLDQDHGWAACSVLWDAGILLSTTDGGESWQTSINVGASDFCSVDFVNTNYGGVVGRNAYYTHILITDNNFNSFLYQYDNFSWNQYAGSICFQNDSTIWITGDPGILNKSIDGGATFNVYQTIDARLGGLQFFDNTGYVFGNNNALYKFDGESGIEQELQVNECILYQNYPNPFNLETEIQFTLQEGENVKLVIYNSKGELVRTLFEGLKGKGMHTINFDASGLDSGLYFYKLTKENHTITRKMLFLK